MHGYANLVCFNICLVPFGVTVTKHPGLGLYFCYPLSSSGFVACTSPSPFCQESPAHNISGTRSSAGLATSSCHVLSWRRCSFSRTNIHQFPDSSAMTSRLSIFESNMTSSNIIHLNPSDRTLRLKHDMYWYVLICQCAKFHFLPPLIIAFRSRRQSWDRVSVPQIPAASRMAKIHMSMLSKEKRQKNDEVIFLTFWCGFFNLRTAS